MLETIIFIPLVRTVMTFAIAYGVLAALDWSGKRKGWQPVKEKILETPQGAAFYYGCRLLFAAIIAGAVNIL